MPNNDLWYPVPGVDKHCFACGCDNPHGLQMQFESNGTQLRSRVVMHGRFRGWSSLVHGGIISTILDETMSWTVIVLTRKFMLTKGMQVEFHRPLQVNSPVTAAGFITERMGERRVKVVAEITDESGERCASSHGEFALFTKEQFLRMGIMGEKDLELMEAVVNREHVVPEGVE